MLATRVKFSAGWVDGRESKHEKEGGLTNPHRQGAVPSVESSVESPAPSLRSSRTSAAGIKCLNSSIGSANAQTTSFSTLPPLETLLAAADSYFKYCHNQPYAVFHEQSFREQLASGTLPPHVIFAFYATAIRFSPDPRFRENRSQAIDGYAKESWKSIILPWNGLESAAEIGTAQAILLLGIIDYTGASLCNILSVRWPALGAD